MNIHQTNLSHYGDIQHNYKTKLITSKIIDITFFY